MLGGARAVLEYSDGRKVRIGTPAGNRPQDRRAEVSVRPLQLVALGARVGHLDHGGVELACYAQVLLGHVGRAHVQLSAVGRNPQPKQFLREGIVQQSGRELKRLSERRFDEREFLVIYLDV